MKKMILLMIYSSLLFKNIQNGKEENEKANQPKSLFLNYLQKNKKIKKPIIQKNPKLLTFEDDIKPSLKDIKIFNKAKKARNEDDNKKKFNSPLSWWFDLNQTPGADENHLLFPIKEKLTFESDENE